MLKNIILLSVFLIPLLGQAQNYSQTTKAVASDRRTGDYFGWHVALSGNYAVIGSHYNDEGDDQSDNSGAAYVYESDGLGNWTETQKLTASKRQAGANFGGSICISENYIVVGAWDEGYKPVAEDTIKGVGAVYIFEKDINNRWIETQKIISPIKYQYGYFGASVTIEGTTLVIGATGEDLGKNLENSVRNAGAAYIFERNTTGIWEEKQRLVSSDRKTYDAFGQRTSISGDYIIFGSEDGNRQLDSRGYIVHSGEAYVYGKDENGIWKETQKLVPHDLGVRDRFGGAVSILDSITIIGSSAAKYQGAAYIFELGKDGVWSQKQRLVSRDLVDYDYFGGAVSMAKNQLVVGATGKNSSKGVAYVFDKNDSGYWVQSQKLVASNRNSYDYFGDAVAISGDHILVGTNTNDFDTNNENELQGAGAVYFFEKPPTITTIESSNNKEITVYPNPNNGYFTIDLGTNNNSAQITIKDITGRTITSLSDIDNQVVNLEIDKSSGVYIVEVISENRTFVTRINVE